MGPETAPMWKLLMVAALAATQPIEQVLDQMESTAAGVPLQIRLVPSSLDPDVLWMPYDASVKKVDEKHWIPPLRLGITEKSLEDWPAQDGDFHCNDQLDRSYYVPLAQRFATQHIPFQIGVQVEASRAGDQSCTLQVELATTVLSDARATDVATTRIRIRQAEGQVLTGQSLVISNLYPYEEVLPILGDLPTLGRLFQASSTGPMVVITPG